MSRVHAKIKPCLPGFVVAWNVVVRVAGKVGDVEPLLRELVDLGQKFPAESDSFFLQWMKGEGNGRNEGDTHLEVVPERPITEHLEKSMVVRVFSDILEV